MEQGLLERDHSVADLRRAHSAAAEGQGSVQLITGPAGIGKSVLLQAVGRLAEDDGNLVLAARASGLDRNFGFGIVHQLLEPVFHADDERRSRLLSGAAGRAAGLFGPTVTEVDPEYGVLSGLYWLVANLAEERPLTLLVDDLQWADDASLRFLEYLGRRLGDLPVLVAGTVRSPEPPPELLAAIEASPATAKISLDALSPDAVAAILERHLGAAPSAGFLEAACRATGGNPLLATVLAREAATRGLRGVDRESDGLAELGAGGVAPMVAHRLRNLPADQVTVARVAAILGERADREDLVALSGLDEGRVSTALAGLAGADLIEPGGGWTFRHPLVLAAVIELVPGAERDAIHRRAAPRLRERGARPAEVALHWLATRPSGDPTAVADLRAAAAVARTEGAVSTAVELLRRALDEGVTAKLRPRLLLDLAELELLTLQPEGPGRMREALAAGLEAGEEARGRAALGRMLMLADPASGLAEIDAARAATGDPGDRLRLDASLLEGTLLVDAIPAGRDDRYRAIREKRNPSVAELAHLASEEALGGRVEAGRVAELAGRAAAGGLLLREVGPDGATWNLLTHALRFAERPDEARRLLEEGDRVVRRRGLRAAGTFVDQSWAYWHRDFGSAAHGLARARSGYDGILDAGLPVSVWSLTSIMAENLVLLDRVAEADALLDEPLGAVENTFVEPFALSARGLVRLHKGRTGEAESDLRRVIAILDRHGWRAPAAARARMRLGELLATTGRPKEALELVAEDEYWARRAGVNGALGCVLRVRALAEEGDQQLATRQQAVEALAASPLLAERSFALLDLGTSLSRGGELEQARTVLRHALDFASRCESVLLLRKVRAALEASGGRPRRERISGLESLTPSERRVADLVAEGMTNRQVAETLWITRKTVEYHLGNVYRKLAIKSRTALAGILNAHPGPPGGMEE